MAAYLAAVQYPVVARPCTLRYLGKQRSTPTGHGQDTMKHGPARFSIREDLIRRYVAQSCRLR